MSTFLDNWLLRRAMSAPMGGGGYGPDDYIQNGLVFQLDGLAMGNNPTKWADRKGVASFTFNEHVVKLADGIQFLGTGVLLSDETFGETNFVDYDASTVEICFTPASGDRSTYVIFKPHATTSFQSALVPVCGFYAGWYLFGNYYPLDGRLSVQIERNISLMSTTFDDALIDGVSYAVGHADSFYAQGNNDHFCLGVESYVPKGILRSVRVYNRKLSLAEMLSNQQIDNERFNLGLSI